jgi:SAM-dependent methyltransferase
MIMPPPTNASRRSFAHVYDALYAGQTAFLVTQVAFLKEVFGPGPQALLDLGCGTGIHVAALAQNGYSVTGVDLDPLMLLAARRKWPGAKIIRADLRRLPFRGSYAGALCLESPLAYLLEEADLQLALASIGTALVQGGRLVIDVFDYPGTLGTRDVGPHEVLFSTPEMQVIVRESHHYEKRNRTWKMYQEFEVDEAGERYSFAVIHELQVRTMDDYARALESAGFEIEQALIGYPQAPRALGRQRRIILVARRKVA